MRSPSFDPMNTAINYASVQFTHSCWKNKLCCYYNQTFVGVATNTYREIEIYS